VCTSPGAVPRTYYLHQGSQTQTGLRAALRYKGSEGHMRPEEKYCGALFMVFNLFLYVLQILLSQNACNNYEKVVKILLLLEYLLKNSEKNHNFLLWKTVGGPHWTLPRAACLRCLSLTPLNFLTSLIIFFFLTFIYKCEKLSCFSTFA
jgi:hypothetical protein